MLLFQRDVYTGRIQRWIFTVEVGVYAYATGDRYKGTF